MNKQEDSAKLSSWAKYTREEKLHTIERLKTGENPQLDQLLEFLSDPDWSIRSLAVDALAEVGGEREAAFVLHLLDDPESAVRSDAAGALGRLGYKLAAQRLVNVLRNDREPLVRVCAAEALGDIGVTSADVKDALITAMNTDHSILVRAYASESLGRLGLAETMPVIRDQLTRERSTRARASMLEALSRLGDSDAFTSLLRIFKRLKNAYIRSAVVNMLIGLATTDNAEVISEAADDVLARDPDFAVQNRQLHEALRRLPRSE